MLARLRSYFIAAALILLAFWALTSHEFTPIPFRARSSTSRAHLPEDDAGNRTLGFERIFALSQHPSWRTRGLEAAANLTDLQIAIPPQPPILNRLATAFANIGSIQPAHGASKAWLAHLDLLKHIYQSNLDTALILEDDADWDIAIRQQMQNISSAVRDLTQTPADEPAPFGRSWDVLWLGLCVEFWNENTTRVEFDDANVCPHEDYRSWRAEELSHIPNHKRAVWWSNGPVCTFAYAVSHKGARRILKRMGGGWAEAFDLGLRAECVYHLNCISVVPEVFHQYFPPSEFGVKSNVDEGNDRDGDEGPSEDDFESEMGSTENIVHSARCRALWGKDCQNRG